MKKKILVPITKHITDEAMRIVSKDVRPPKCVRDGLVKPSPINIFVNRLKKIGIEVELIGNYPWVYLNTVNGNKVKEKFQANHGFTVFFRAIKPGQIDIMTDITEVFKIIRKYK